MERKNYYLHKDKKSGEILYLEYDKIKGYPIRPKTKIEDAIDVHKIIFINPTLQEKLIRKKVEIKLKYFKKALEELENDDGSSGDVERVIIDAEKLRVNLLSRYIHYLGNTYGSIYLNQLQQIINQLKVLFFKNVQKERYQVVRRQMMNEDLYYLEEENEKKGRGR